MRIALVQKNFHPNSVGLFRGLLSRGHEVMNIVQYDGGIKTGAGSVDVPTTTVPYGLVSRTLLRGNKKRLDRRGVPRVVPLLRLLRTVRPDVVIAKETRTAALVTAGLARIFGATTVLMQDKPKGYRKAPLLAFAGGVLLPRRKFHMGHKGSPGEDLRLGFLLGDSRLMPYPVTLSEASPAAEPPVAPESTLRILSIGAFGNRRKRLGMLVDAIAVSGVADRVLLTFVGHGDERSPEALDVRERERVHGLEPSELWTNVPHHELMDRIQEFDLFVLPARNEPFGGVVPEAMANGLAVICSDTCGARVCFEDHVSGFVFPTDSLDVLADRIRLLAEDRDLLLRMRRAAYLRAQTELSPEIWAERFERLVTEGHRSR